jgi:Plasmid encoded RepA protein
VQATLPHKNPGDIPAWSRTNGNYSLIIQPGWNRKENQSYGFPYGTVPRLLIFWLTTEVLRTGDRRIELGSHLADFMRKLGLNPSRGGKRSDAHRLREQMQRLFRAKITFEYESGKQQSWYDLQIAPKGMVWWNQDLREEPDVWESWVELGEEFYKAITYHPIPVDMNALQHLKNSAMGLDLYAWLTHEAYRASANQKSRRVPWRALQQQLGADYSDYDNFRKKVLKTLQEIKIIYPGLNLDRYEGGLEIKPSATSIASKPAKAIAAKVEQPAPPAIAEVKQENPSHPSTPLVSSALMEKAKEIGLKAGTGWDIYAIEQQFYEYIKKKGIPEKFDAAFLGFVRKKVKISP